MDGRADNKATCFTFYRAIVSLFVTFSRRTRICLSPTRGPPPCGDPSLNRLHNFLNNSTDKTKGRLFPFARTAVYRHRVTKSRERVLMPHKVDSQWNFSTKYEILSNGEQKEGQLCRYEAKRKRVADKATEHLESDAVVLCLTIDERSLIHCNKGARKWRREKEVRE